MNDRRAKEAFSVEFLDAFNWAAFGPVLDALAIPFLSPVDPCDLADRLYPGCSWAGAESKPGRQQLDFGEANRKYSVQVTSPPFKFVACRIC